MIDKATGLSEKQKAFCDYDIANGGNGTQAAKDAGYKGKNDKVFDSVARENLGKPRIKKYIDERMAEIESKRIASADEAMQIITSLARGEPNANGKLPPAIVQARCAETLLRVYGKFDDKLTVRNEGPIVLAGDDLVPD